MKDKNGKSIGLHCTVKIIGDDNIWTVTGFDGFGGLDIKCNVTGITLSRHPNTLIVI
jgi:hypothetical protein